MGRRAEREDMIIEVCLAWERDGRKSGFAPVSEDLYGLGFVSPGDTSEGRGSTLFDLTRSSILPGGVSRWDAVSVKTHGIGGDGKKPSYADLITGSKETIQAVIRAAMIGRPIPVFHFISRPNSDGTPGRDGMFLAYDAAKYIRASLNMDSVPNPVGFQYSKGSAPAAYLAMVEKASGGKYKKHVPGTRHGWTIATGETTLAYPQMRIAYQAAGLSGAWRPCTIEDVPGILESYDWGTHPGAASTVW